MHLRSVGHQRQRLGRGGGALAAKPRRDFRGGSSSQVLDILRLDESLLQIKSALKDLERGFAPNLV